MQSKDTGQLAVSVYIANAAGCVARIFTSIQEGGGYAMVRGFLLGEAQCKAASKQLHSIILLAQQQLITAWQGSPVSLREHEL